MRAETAPPNNFIYIEDVCDGCILRQGLSETPTMLLVKRSTDDPAKTELLVPPTSDDKPSTVHILNGVKSRDAVIDDLNTEIEQVSENGHKKQIGAAPEQRVACNALCELLNQRRQETS